MSDRADANTAPPAPEEDSIDAPEGASNNQALPTHLRAWVNRICSDLPPMPGRWQWIRSELTHFARQPLAWILATATLLIATGAMGLAALPVLLAAQVYMAIGAISVLARRAQVLRRRAERIEQGERDLRAILRQLPGAVWLSVDGGRRRIALNDHFTESMGLRLTRADGGEDSSDSSTDECIGADWIDRVLPADIDHVVARMKKAARRREEYAIEYRARSSDGEAERFVDLAAPLSTDIVLSQSPHGNDEAGDAPPPAVFIGVTIPANTAHERAAALERELDATRDRFGRTEQALTAAQAKCERLERDEAELCVELQALRDTLMQARGEAMHAADKLTLDVNLLAGRASDAMADELLRHVGATTEMLRGLLDPDAAQRSAASSPSLFHADDDEDAEVPAGNHPRVHARFWQDMLMCDLGDVLDLSLGGMRIRGRGRAPAGTMKVTLKDDNDEPVIIKCDVAWTRRTGLRAYEAGLRFIDVDTELAQAITRISMSNRRRRIFEVA